MDCESQNRYFLSVAPVAHPICNAKPLRKKSLPMYISQERNKTHMLIFNIYLLVFRHFRHFHHFQYFQNAKPLRKKSLPMYISQERNISQEINKTNMLLGKKTRINLHKSNLIIKIHATQFALM